MVNKSTLSICIGACLLGAQPAIALAASDAPENVSIYGAGQGSHDGYDPIVDPVTGELLSQEDARALFSIQGAAKPAPQVSNITIQGSQQSRDPAAWTELPTDAAILPLGDEVVMHADNNAPIVTEPKLDSATAMAEAQAANTPVEKAKRAVAVGKAQREAEAKAAALAKAKAEAEEAQAKANAALQAQAQARALELAKAKQAQMQAEQQKIAKANEAALASTARDTDAQAKANLANSGAATAGAAGIAAEAAVAAGPASDSDATPAAQAVAALATANDVKAQAPDPKQPAVKPKDRADADNVAKAIAAVKEQYNSPYEGPTTKDERRYMAKHYGKSYNKSGYQYVAKPMLPPQPAYKEAKLGSAWDPTANKVSSYPNNVVAAATAAAAATASTSAAVTAAAQSAANHTAQGPFQGTVTTVEQQQAQAAQMQSQDMQAQAMAAQGQSMALEEQAMGTQVQVQGAAQAGQAAGGSKIIAVGSDLEVNGTQVQSNQATREQLVRVYGTNTPSMVGTVEEVAEYRMGLPSQPSVNYVHPNNVYTYTDQYGNTVMVQNPNGYDLGYGVYVYGNYGIDGHPLPPSWIPPSSWPPAGQQYPSYAPPPGMQQPTGPVTPNTPGWPADQGTYPPAAWQPNAHAPNYAPPPGMMPPSGHVRPSTPGWPADSGVDYVQPHK